MSGVLVWMVLPVAVTLGAGIWLELKPRRLSGNWLKGGLLANVALFGLGLAGAMLMGVQDVLAADPVAAAAGEITLGQGLALLGIGLPIRGTECPSRRPDQNPTSMLPSP